MADEIESYGLINKQPEVNTALALNAVFAAERLNNKNNAFLNALNSKNPEQIETAITELTGSIDAMKLWLMRYLKPSSRAGQILQKLNIKPLKGMEGKTAAEYVETANLKLNDYIIPKLGVYAVRVKLEKNRRFLKGIANLGYRPTFNQKKILLEVNLFNFNKNIYNKKLTVEFLKFIRREKKFSGIDELRKQINVDLKKAKK